MRVDRCSRRFVPSLSTAAVLLCCGSWLTAATVDASAQEINAFIGPNYGDPVDRTLTPVMKDKFKTKVSWQEGLSTAAFAKILAQRNSPEFDVACMNTADFLNAVAAKLFTPLDTSKITNMATLWDHAQREPYGKLGVPITMGGSVLQYRTDVFKEKGWPAPTKWTDLADPKLKGRVGLTSLTSGVGMETLSIWSKNGGGKRGDVEPGIAFAKRLVSSGQVVAFPKKGSDANQLLISGEIWAATHYSQSALTLQAQGAPVATVYPTDGAPVSMTVCGVVANSKNQALANEFINLLISAETQRAFVTKLWASPTYKNLTGLPPEYQGGKLMLTEEQVKYAWFPDQSEFAEFKMQWFKRWIEEVEAAAR